MTTRDEVLAMAREAGFAVYEFEAYRPYNRTLVQGDSFNAERFHALAVAKYKEDAERYRWLREQHEGKLPIEMDADGFPMPQEVAALAFTVFYPDPTGDESLVVVPMELLRQLRHYTECHRMVFKDCGAPTQSEVDAMLRAAQEGK